MSLSFRHIEKFPNVPIKGIENFVSIFDSFVLRRVSYPGDGPGYESHLLLIIHG